MVELFFFLVSFKALFDPVQFTSVHPVFWLLRGWEMSRFIVLLLRQVLEVRRGKRRLDSLLTVLINKVVKSAESECILRRKRDVKRQRRRTLLGDFVEGFVRRGEGVG